MSEADVAEWTAPEYLSAPKFDTDRLEDPTLTANRRTIARAFLSDEWNDESWSIVAGFMYESAAAPTRRAPAAVTDGTATTDFAKNVWLPLELISIVLAYLPPPEPAFFPLLVTLAPALSKSGALKTSIVVWWSDTVASMKARICQNGGVAADSLRSTYLMHGPEGAADELQPPDGRIISFGIGTGSIVRLTNQRI